HERRNVLPAEICPPVTFLARVAGSPRQGATPSRAPEPILTAPVLGQTSPLQSAKSPILFYRAAFRFHRAGGFRPAAVPWHRGFFATGTPESPPNPGRIVAGEVNCHCVVMHEN